MSDGDFLGVPSCHIRLSTEKVQKHIAIEVQRTIGKPWQNYDGEAMVKSKSDVRVQVQGHMMVFCS
jgi:hypothetical protein